MLETRQSLENNTLPALIASVSSADTDTLVDGLKKLHVRVVETVMPGNNNPELEPPYRPSGWHGGRQ